ncbi:MAG: 30S ribosomal protein S2 [Thermoguttaceae bacterium]
MAETTLSIKALIESCVHYGHRASLWNPKMRPYVYGRRKLIHIIDVRETVRGILRARKFLKQVAAEGNLVLFVGTKRQASETIKTQADRCGMPYISERWLGGTLTNFETIRSRMRRLEELENIINGELLQTYSKKMQSSLMREYNKMYRNLNGLRKMDRYPAAMVVVDPRKEKNAVREARKLNVVSIALIDTDSDPDEVDLLIPGNDDSIRSIDLVISYLADAVCEGVKEQESSKYDAAQAQSEDAAIEEKAVTE